MQGPQTRHAMPCPGPKDQKRSGPNHMNAGKHNRSNALSWRPQMVQLVNGCLVERLRQVGKLRCTWHPGSLVRCAHLAGRQVGGLHIDGGEQVLEEHSREFQLLLQARQQHTQSATAIIIHVGPVRCPCKSFGPRCFIACCTRVFQCPCKVLHSQRFIDSCTRVFLCM